jgi:deoxyribodipyrimidine photo-lyase
VRPEALAVLPIDHEVEVVGTRGGAVVAAARLERFLCFRLARYVDGRTDLEQRATSELSAHLHFGHIGVHQVFGALAAQERWTPDRLGHTANGKREGWWGMSPPAEAFLDELVTWRELGYLTAYHQRDHDRYEGLPSWARATLELHQDDHRPYLYDREALELGRTHDPIWNAAQGELRTEGTIHNYLRMLWGKKILEWTASPREAFDLLVELNNRWSIDGRNPNSYTGISWVLGRYDRPWAPQRPIFGSIRYMSSASTARKIKLERYLRRYGAS